MQDATIKLLLDTREFIQGLKDISPALQNALDIKDDLSGVEKYQKELKSISDITKNTSKTTGKLTGAYSVSNLDKYEKELTEILNTSDKLKGVNSELAELGFGEGIDPTKRLNQLRGAIGRASDKDAARADYQNAKSLLTKQKDLIAVLGAQYNKLTPAQREHLNNIKKAHDALTQVNADGRTQVDNVNAINAKYKEIVDGIQQEKDEQKQVNDATSQGVETENELNKATGENANSMKQFADSTNEAKKTLNELNEETGKSGTDSATEQIAKDSNKANTELQNLIDKARNLDEAMKINPEEMGIVKMLQLLQEAETIYKGFKKQKLPDMAAPEIKTTVDNMGKLQGYISAYKRELRKTTSMADEVKKGIDDASKASTNFGKTAQASGRKAHKSFSGLSGVVKTIKSGFKGLSGSLKDTSGILGKVKSSFNSMARSMRGNFKHMLTNITKYVLGFRSLFFLVRRLRKYIGEGIQNMAQFNEGNNHVNESITRLLSSLLYLKNAWATAFSPILQYVTPVLERLIDKMAEVGNAFSRFLGSLLGTETVFQAVKVDAADYADSLDNAAGSAGSAADKTKKLTDRLAAFDDLNVLGVDNDPDGTGSGGGGGLADAYEPDPNEMFTLIDVGKEVLEQFKQMWEDADFTELGKNLKYKLITALLTAQENLEEFKEPAYKVGKSIITFLNGVFGDKTIWIEAGKTLGKTVNVVSEFIRGLLENNEVDWGGGLASLINGFFASTDWETIRANIVSFVTQFKDNVISFLKTLDWEGNNGIFEAFKSLGSAIGTAISETVGDAEFMGSLGDALGKLISAILITWKAILDQNDGDEIGNALYEFFASLIDAINWDTLAENLSGSLVLLLNAISKFSENLSEDDTFQQALSDFVENLDLDTVFEALGRNISSSTVAANSIGSVLAETLGNKDVVNKVTEGLKTLVESIDYNAMVSSTVEFLGNLLGSALADPTLPIKIAIAIVEGLIEGLSTALSQWLEGGYEWAEEAGLARDGDGIGEQIVNGLIGGIAKAFEDDPLYNFFKEHFFDPTVKAIKDLFNIDSPSKEMETLGGYIGEGLLNGISNLMPNVEQIFTDFHEWLVGKWDEVKGDTYEKWVGIKTNVTEKAQELKDNAEEKVEALKTSLVGKWQEIKGSIYEKLVGIKTNVLEVFDQLKEGIKNPINGFIDIIEGMVNRVIDGINSLTSALNVLPDIQMTNPITGTEYSLGFTIPTLNSISIPRLAQGAVIPPNREFMAVLGDQSHGTNIEAPLDTIKQAVAEVIANNGNEEVINLLQQLITVVESKNLVIGDKEIGKANARYVNQQKLIRGTSI